jgi:nucleotide-binding universal stress UspA family protein
MFGAILAGADASGKGRNAVRLGRLLADATGDRLVIVAVRSDPLVELPAIHLDDTTPLTAQLDRQLCRLRDELAPDAFTAVEPAVSVGEGLRMIVRRERAGLVVVGVAPDRHGRERVLEGDDALDVLHDVPCSVVVMAEEREPPRSIERVAVGVVDAPEAAAACAAAADIARRTGATLRFVSVVGNGPGFPPRARHAERGAEAEALVQRAVAESAVPGASGDVLTGSVVDALARVSDEADLLVLGSHRGDARRPPSSRGTTAGVLHAARCPVLVTAREAQEPGNAKAAAQEAAR